MTLELREIPPSRRQVRWSAVFWRRWPLGLLGVVLAVYGGLIALVFFHAQSVQKDRDARIDRGEQGVATVQKIDAGPRGSEHVHYRFFVRDRMGQQTEMSGKVTVAAGRFEQGGTYEVQYCAVDPTTNRLAGTRISQFGDLVSPMLGFVVFPGLLLILLWLQSIVDLKSTLARGDAGVAEITATEPVAAVVPSMLRVRYRFRDYHARWCGGGHWVPARSALGERLRAGDVQAVVIHDRRRPERSRLVVAVDFAPGLPHPARIEPAETA